MIRSAFVELQMAFLKGGGEDVQVNNAAFYNILSNLALVNRAAPRLLCRSIRERRLENPKAEDKKRKEEEVSHLILTFCQPPRVTAGRRTEGKEKEEHEQRERGK